MQRLRLMAVLGALALLASSCTTLQSNRGKDSLRITAEAMPALDSIGFAGLYVGESNGVILAAGGTNFPGDPPWKKGKKHWYDTIWACDGKQWNAVGKLSKPLAMGASITTPLGVLCVGGGDEETVIADAYLLRYEDGKAVREDLPAFPRPIMGSVAAVIGSRAYIVGGHSTPNALDPGPLQEVWSIDVSNPSAGWQSETPIPGPGRWLPVVGTDGANLFVISGFSKAMGDDGKAAIHCLMDVWKYTPASGGKGTWAQLPNLPRGNAGAPSMAPYVNRKLLILGAGVEDSYYKLGPMETRPGFPTTITAIDVVTGKSSVVGSVKSSVVAAQGTWWKGGFVVVSGEIRGGVRTPAVWSYRFK